MNDSYSLAIMAKQRQADFEREARLRRLRRARTGMQTGIGAWAFGVLGDLLIRTGRTIKSKYGPPVSCNQDLHGGPKPCKVRA